MLETRHPAGEMTGVDSMSIGELALLPAEVLRPPT